MKEKLKIRNTEFKYKNIEACNRLRNKGIIGLTSYRDEYLKLKPIYKLEFIKNFIYILSLYKDEEVLTLMKYYEIGEDVTNYFVYINDIYEGLDKYVANSKYIVPYEVMMQSYIKYSESFFMIKLSEKMGFDLNKISSKTYRQEKNGNLPEDFLEFKDYLNEFKVMVNNENPGIALAIKERSIASSLKKHIRYHTKIYFYNLYHTLLDFNKEINHNEIDEPDFKWKFYDLYELLILDKEELKADIDSELNYGDPGNRRFKIKRVEGQILRCDNFVP